jgi:hypothetical protein
MGAIFLKASRIAWSKFSGIQQHGAPTDSGKIVPGLIVIKLVI